MYAWLTIFLACILMIRGVRESLKPFPKMIFFDRLTPYFIAIIGYVSLLIYVAHKVRIWDIGMLKHTVYWFLGTAVILSFGVNNALTEDHYFKKVVLRSLRLTVL